jgi:type VI protein secretion system component Hcp
MVRLTVFCGVVVLLALLWTIPVDAEIQPQYMNSFCFENDPDLAGLGDLSILTWEWASGRSILAEAPNLAGGAQMNREHILLASGNQLKFTPPSTALVSGKAPDGVFRLMKPLGSSSKSLMDKCIGNRRIPGMKLALCTAGTDGSAKSTLVRFELKNVTVTSYRVWGPGAGPRKGLVGVPANKPLVEISIAYGSLKVSTE